MRTRALLSILVVAAALAVAAPTTGAARSGGQPFQVEHASLAQDGQQVKWTVQLSKPFSAAAPARARRELCLLLERPKDASVTAQICVIAPRPGRQVPRIFYQRVTRSGPDPGFVLAAAVTGAGARELTATFVPSTFGMAYRPVRWQVLSAVKPPGCRPATPDRGCVSLFPSQPALTELHTPQLVGCVANGAPFVNSGPSGARVIALTFDDGPWNDTPAFLNVLEHYHVPATFFEIGEQISTYGQGGAIERRMLADGDMVGDHTWNHANVSAGGSFAAAEIGEAASAIKQATNGFAPCLFRAPYGATSSSLISTASSMGFKTIQWDIDPRDWARPGTDTIYNNVVANAHPGAIVLQHDGGGDRSQTIAALPREIQTLRGRGYRFVTITQLFGMKLLYK